MPDATDPYLAYVASIDARLTRLDEKIEAVLSTQVTQAQCALTKAGYDKALEKYMPKAYAQVAMSIVLFLGALIALFINIQKVGGA